MKTVRVRIAVAVSNDGKHWSSVGSSCYKDARITDGAEFLHEDVHDGQYNCHWVEADIPLPESQTIEGEVTQ